jgi:hypothetical protein
LVVIGRSGFPPALRTPKPLLGDDDDDDDDAEPLESVFPTAPGEVFADAGSPVALASSSMMPPAR